MLQLLGGVVSAINLGLSLYIGIRLLRLVRGSEGAPERWLGWYFLLAPFLGMGLSGVAYMAWADPELALSEPWASISHAGYHFGTTAGMACLYVFVWKTFRPNDRWARNLVWTAWIGMIVGFVGIGFTDSYSLVLVPGIAHWETWAVRTAVYLWLLIESLRFWSLSRKRVRVGLASPLVTNRFLLFGFYGGVLLAMGFIDPVARYWYVTTAGQTEQWVPELGSPIIHAMITASFGLGIVVMIVIYLAFFPTPAYKRWISKLGAGASTGS